ncbi:retrovirus-related pol polyprotein from transposon TNT 1-94 [Tanacetum coccineum]
MLLAKQNETGIILTDEQNDFLFADASRMEEIEELSANISLMARIQPTDHSSDDGPSYESAFVSEVQSSSIDENNEPMNVLCWKPKPLSVYDQQLKHGLGYPNPYTLKQAISKCPKLYVASSLGNLEIPLNVKDSEDTLEDAFKSQQTMKEKMNDPIAVANKQIIPVSKNMPSESPLIKELDKIKGCFEKLDIKEMKDVFESIESELDELEKQNDLLKDQLLEASLKHDVELCVLLNHECIDKILNAELQQLQHKKEKHKRDSTSKNKNTNPLDYSWISKLEKLENENVSLDFKVQSLIKERDNVKLEYQKLFDSIKKTRSQTQKEIDELIVHVFEKTYAYGATRAENQNLVSTISELKTRLEKVEKGKSVNTKFDQTNGYQSILCVIPLNKHDFQKKTDVPKTEENHVVSKPVTLQTSPTKQTGANQNTNVIRPGMYRVVTTQESQTNKTKSALSSTGMNATSRVRRPMSRDSHVAHSVLDNSKKAAKNVAVYVRKNKQTDNTSADVIPNKENVIDVDVANASKAKTLLCVTCMQKVLIPCQDKCIAKLKLNVRLNVHRTFFTNSRTSKSLETTFVAPKTRFSEKEKQSMTLDTTSIVSKSKIDVESASKAKDKQSQAMGNLEGDDLLIGGRESNLYTISISDMAASSPVCLMSKATSTKSWLWHRRLSHLNFDTINDLTRLDLVTGSTKVQIWKGSPLFCL